MRSGFHLGHLYRCSLFALKSDHSSRLLPLADDVLTGAPTFTQIWPDLVKLLTTADAPLYSWNVDFDRQVLLKTAQRFQLPILEMIADKKRWRCAMKWHARWYGEWSNGKDDYRWQPLEWACTELEIQGSGRHRAVDDAQNALSVLRSIAERAGKYSPPVEMPYFDRYYGD